VEEATQSTETPLEFLVRKMRDTAAAPADRWRLRHSAIRSCRQWLTGFVTGTATMGALESAARHTPGPPDETAVGRESVRRALSSCGSCAPVAEGYANGLGHYFPLLTSLLSSRFGQRLAARLVAAGLLRLRHVRSPVTPLAPQDPAPP